jgi:hypothetical protein
MSRLSLSLESLTSQGKAECWKSPASEKSNASGQKKGDDSFLAELLKPRQHTAEDAVDSGGLLSPTGTKSDGIRESANGQGKPSNSLETSIGEVILAMTYSSALYSSQSRAGGASCFLRPREGKDQYGLEWYQRELEYLQTNPSERLLAFANESSRLDLNPAEIRATEEVVESLESRIRRSGPLSALQARSLLSDCLKALDEFHKRGRLHAELNPSRILYASSDRLVLFGSPGFRPEDELRPLFSQDLFAAPELLNPEDFGKISRSSDLYCLGHIMLYSLLGKSYFGLLKARDVESPRQAECLAWHGSQADKLPEIEDLLPDAPPTLVSVIARLVEKESKQRYQTVSEALADLNATFSKTRKGKLERRKAANRPGMADVGSMLQGSLGPVTPPPLVEQAEPERSSKLSRLPARILLSSLALLLLILVSGMLSSSNPAEQVADHDASGESEREVVEETAEEPEAKELNAEGPIPEPSAPIKSENDEDGAYTEPDLVPESDALMARESDKANLASREPKPAASVNLPVEKVASESQRGINQHQAIAGPKVGSVEVAETPDKKVRETTLVSKTTMVESHASQEYLDQLSRILSSFRHKSYLKRHEAHAPWFESTAKKVEALETDGVDPAAIEAGQFVASSLRSTATRLREASSGVASESRSRQEQSRSDEYLQLLNPREVVAPALSPQAAIQTISQRGDTESMNGRPLKISSPQAMSQHGLAQMKDKVAEAQKRLAGGQ